MTNQEKAIEAAKRLVHNAKEFRIGNYHSEFLNGSLYVINFENDNGTGHCFVYTEGEQLEVCKNQALLNEFVARKSKKLGASSIITSLGGIAGLIGLIITLAIVFLLVFRPTQEIPKELWGALLAIMAYYFGSKNAK